MTLSRRLLSLAGLVIDSDNVADIGCDHALLDIYLVKNKIVNHVLVSDKNKDALDSGIRNIKKHHLEEHIEAKLGDGLSVIDDNIDTLIISGMGSNTIIKILSSKKLKQINKLIIQSNNDHALLRRFLCMKGYYISHEAVIYDHGKYYINIVFLKGNKNYTAKEFKYGPILMYGNKDYFDFLYKKQESILENIPRYKLIKRIRMRKDLLYLKKLVE